MQITLFLATSKHPLPPTLHTAQPSPQTGPCHSPATSSYATGRPGHSRQFHPAPHQSHQPANATRSPASGKSPFGKHQRDVVTFRPVKWRTGYLKPPPRHLIHHPHIALDDADHFRGNVLVHIVRHGEFLHPVNTRL